MRLSGRLLLASLLMLVSPIRCEAGGTNGATPFDFLFLDANARPVALGGAYAALSQDANALLYNPAGLGALQSHDLTLMHNQYFQGITQEYGAFAYKFRESEEYNEKLFRGSTTRHSSGWGIMFNMLNFGKIQRTTLSSPDGTGLGAFGIQDWEVALGYGRTFGKDLSLGFAGKGIRETIDKTTVLAGAADVGALYQLPWLPLSLGLSVQNIGPTVRYKLERTDLPLNVRAGLAFRWRESGTVVLDVNQPKKGDLTTHVGVEYTALQRLAMRLGYNGRNDAASGITMGLGIILPGASIDYAFVPLGDLGDAHRISLSLHW